jgi:hypothetical protein
VINYSGGSSLDLPPSDTPSLLNSQPNTHVECPTNRSTRGPCPTASATCQRAAALKKCKKKHGAARKKCKKKAKLLPV